MAGLRIWLRGLFPGHKDLRNERPGSEESTGPSFPQEQSKPLVPQSFADDNNDFALAMYGRLRQRPGNLFFSPFSIRTALSMTQAGARGETAAEMIKALRISSSADTLHVASSDIIERLKSAGEGKYEMAVANSLWGQDGEPVQPGFLELIASHFDGLMKLVDFRASGESARVEINRWVEDKTKQKIQDLIPPGSLNADTRLVLVNAVYFKGTWVLQFEKMDTRDEPFFLEDGGKVRVPLMHQHDRLRYMKAGGYQAVELIYMGGDLSMLILLPDRKDELQDLEKKLSARMLRDCVAEMRIREVKLFLPRFKITWGTVDMRDYLIALGMPLAFTRFQADFSGINGYEPPAEESLFLSAVFHKAFVDVHEEGTEAAAATSVGVMIGSARRPSKPPPIPVFRADHPFLFAIRDRKKGAVLFLGRMVDPSRES